MKDMTQQDRGQKVLGGAVPLRFVQIVTATDAENGDTTLGLDAEGQVWEFRTQTRELGKFKKDHNGQDTLSRERELWTYWHPLRMSAEPGPQHEGPPAFVGWPG